MTSIVDWQAAVFEFFNETNLSVNDRKQLLENGRSAETVKRAVESNNSTRTEERLFIAAVASAGTHSDIIDHFSGSVPAIVTGPVAMLLRYSYAMETLLEFKGTGYFPGAFVFGAVRVMTAAAAEHMQLFLDLSGRFEEVDKCLRRLDGNLNELHMDTVMPCLIRILIDILRFCGHVTKYIKGILLQLLILKKFVRGDPNQ